MPQISCEFEFLGHGLFVGQVYGPRGSAEFKATDLDEALSQIREAFNRLGQPLTPSPVPEPPPPLEVEPRYVRHAPKPDTLPPVAAQAEPPSPPRQRVTRAEAGRMRAAADAEAAGSAAEAEARKAAFAGRRL